MSDETKVEVKARDLSPEEAEKAFAGEEDDAAPGAPDDGSGPPEWGHIPQGLNLPAVGTQVAFLRIPAKWTRNPSQGDRTCVVWPIGETEERLAYGRSRGDVTRSMTELTKAAIRAIDGHRADWSGDLKKEGSVTEFWTSIGPKGRSMIRNWYLKTHSVSDEEALDFFSNHFVSMTVRPG